MHESLHESLHESQQRWEVESCNRVTGFAPGPDPPNQQGNRVLEAGQQGNLPRVPRGGSTPASTVDPQ